MADGTDIEVIAPNGDVILVVGDEKNAKAKLRVSSHTLSSTSPVFKAMFGPHFREGQQLNSAVPAEILLPDDDPDAMTLLCRLVHSREAPAEDERLVDNFKMLPAALAFDKYRVVGPLHWQIRGVLSHWLSDFDTNVDSVTVCAGTVAAAYLLNCGDAYNRATAFLINVAEDSITKLLDRPDITNIIPLQVLLILEERRAAVRAKFDDDDVDDDGIVKDEGLCLHCSKAGKQDRKEKCVGRHGAS